jgi:hypothetical protein
MEIIKESNCFHGITENITSGKNSHPTMLGMVPSKTAAHHTKDAVQIWRDCASLRIIIQTALQIAHRTDFSSDPSCGTEAHLISSIGDLLSVSSKRLNSSEASQPAIYDWDNLESLNQSVMSFCLRESDKWHESTKLPNRKNLKALDQSVSAQMEYVMNDPDQRAIKRCRGSSAEEYDDAPLYAALLKESVQKGASGDEYTAMKMASKFGKRTQNAQVDRRASKGRKIRYSQIEKLANFMAPRPVPLSEGIPITDELLINAFVNSVFQ